MILNVIALFHFPTKICAQFSSVETRWSNWNFNTVCRMVSIRGRLLFTF